MKLKKEAYQKVISALDDYDHTIEDETDDYIVVEMKYYSDWDDIAKESGNGEYFTCEVCQFGEKTIESIFFNYLTDDWQVDGYSDAQIRVLSEEEIEEAERDEEINNNATDHPLYEKYKEYCENWQSNFNSNYGYYSGNRRKTTQIMGNEPIPFSEFLKINED